ncbi:DUF4124 domain-containing protein [Endozoicomonas sp. SM1973]|uniref:DUF4124 domain-containing protein n=1 Tax=Spartinivicinus marinus TaxID=2994442 RepID=A0A853INA3_9GAMM|nr:DUF4124 domain-containing protein [Spartinivicinus marinus]MCX4026323.1 DUF4124 domain-containing protein [Spartinivicinus marinus]NYZ69306.1 DUF4124 domain-containing protein [Spartinivicinus marinus]
MKKLFLLTSLILISTNLIAGKFYKWVDENGVTHYSTEPPKQGQGKVVNTRAQKPSSQEAGEKQLKTIKDTEAAKQKEQTEKEEFEKDLAKAKKEKDEHCKQAKQNKIQLTIKNRVRMTMEDGSVKVLSQEEKEEQLKRAYEAIKEWCN